MMTMSREAVMYDSFEILKYKLQNFKKNERHNSTV